MQFNSTHFMLFFPIVVALYFVVPKKLRSIWLLVASYYFYMSWNPQYALLIGFSTVVTFLCGIGIEKIKCRPEEYLCVRKGKIKAAYVLIIALVVNLLILIVFKYGNFILELIDYVLQIFHIGNFEKRTNLLLPVGISFYTFQALGYVIDVYKGRIKAEKNLIRYALFVSFFPQLVAGPIERSENLLKQIRSVEKIKLWNARRVTAGAILMIWGLFMKMVIADRISILVNMVFDNYRMYGSTELIAAAVGFAIQIYCDFSSYSLIAIGSAKVMGFELMENFNTPYFAVSIKDFWDRWHISLSTWFRDYLYIPLGGNRHGEVRKAINLMIVFLVSGLWHGAAWKYVAWGGIHGIYRIVEELLSEPYNRVCKAFKVKTACFSYRLLQTMVTFALVTFAWIFFRADTIRDAFRFIKRILTKPTPWLLFNGGLYNLGLDRVEMNILVFALLLLFLVDFVRYAKKQTIDIFLLEQNIWFEWTVIIVLILMLFIFGEYGPSFDAQQFIYFQF